MDRNNFGIQRNYKALQYFNYKLGLGTHLFIKVPRPGDSEGAFSVFESSYHLLLPV